MAAVLGLTGGLALAKESVYGTAVATTRGLPVISESLTLAPARVETAALRGGGFIMPDSNVRIGPVQGAGSIQTYLFSTGAALLFEGMLGAIATNGVGPYVHTATLAKELPSYAVDVGIGALTTTKVKRVEGLMVSSWEIGVALGEHVTLGLDVVYEDEVVVASGETGDDVAGTFPTGQVPFLAQEVVVTLGGNSYCLQSLTLGGNNTLKVEHCIGSRLITKPTRNGRPVFSGSLTMKESDTDNDIYDAFVAGDVLDLVITMTEGSNTCVVTSTVRVDGTSPMLTGQEELMLTVPFVAQVDDGAGEDDDDALSVVVTNGDTTP